METGNEGTFNQKPLIENQARCWQKSLWATLSSHHQRNQAKLQLPGALQEEHLLLQASMPPLCADASSLMATATEALRRGKVAQVVEAAVPDPLQEALLADATSLTVAATDLVGRGKVAQAVKAATAPATQRGFAGIRWKRVAECGVISTQALTCLHTASSSTHSPDWAHPPFDRAAAAGLLIARDRSPRLIIALDNEKVHSALSEASQSTWLAALQCDSLLQGERSPSQGAPPELPLQLHRLGKSE